ncbi:nucleotide-diphospho-sugar transferase-domain-containing protein [Phascolomyces articulosus]|uniref:Nucleotide-diphospho-sugar transferase-domain-containing protein n=1 Tax=Phascolomyces articulosus TaxID=60185 RepID=A0AAD5JTQ6_9FUNG|nr:nucleotide-diphospho-sugar transferase-domain-containing protein [Phascolomyces articulosus]
MERTFNKRFLITILCIVFFISLATLLSSLIPRENWFNKNTDEYDDIVQHSLSNKNKPSTLTTNDGDTLNENDNIPEEDLVEVKVAPTQPDAWKPKQFKDPDSTIRKAIDHNLRKEKQDKILLVAVANQGMVDYTLNWIESLKRTGQDQHYLVFAIDTALQQTLTKAGYADHVVQIPEEWFHKKLSSGFAKWLDNDYTPITHAKTLVVERLLYMDITVWFSDVDIVFTRPGIYRYLLDKLNARGKTTQALFTQETEQKIVNSGFYIMRPTDLNKRILDDAIVIQDQQPKVTQQRAINRVLDELDLSYQTSPIVLLDLPLFPHGRLFFERHIPAKYDMEPMIVHANYRVGDKKKEALQGAHLWYI